MPSVLIHFDDATYRELNRAARRGKRKRAEFIREAVKAALRNEAFAKIREAYRKQPQSAAAADDWAELREIPAVRRRNRLLA